MSSRADRVRDSIIRNFGEDFIFPNGTIKAVLEWTTPPEEIGNTQAERPRPYLLVRDIDIECQNVKARDKVMYGEKQFELVSEPLSDGYGLSRIYIRGEL